MDKREFHDGINEVAAQHLGAFQVLGAVLGGVVGALGLSCDLSCVAMGLPGFACEKAMIFGKQMTMLDR